MEFTLLKKSRISRARIGLLRTKHGDVETPAFIPVATQAVIKTLASEQVEETKSQMIIANTFHLHNRPGETLIKKSGGLHIFMNWKKPIMTDSGGFQVFSLGFGKDYGTGKILKDKINDKIYKGQQPMSLRITEDGVFFNSPLDGKKLFLGPKESIKIQHALGADIIFAFDECTSPIADYAYTKKSMEKTHRWAKQCLQYHSSDQALYGIVQGGKFKDLRATSAKIIGSMSFSGFGIGGEFGDDKRKMALMLRWVIEELSEKKPRHLLGIGHLDDIETIIKEGIDTFDCIAPTHYARHGSAFTSHGMLNMQKSVFLKDKKPLDKSCMCFTCNNYTRQYICHLYRANEITALSLLTFHNLYFFNSYVEKIREKIKRGVI